jgi:hypothetical protein
MAKPDCRPLPPRAFLCDLFIVPIPYAGFRLRAGEPNAPLQRIIVAAAPRRIHPKSRRRRHGVLRHTWPASCVKTNNTMALNMRNSKSYPLQDALIEFGRSSCLVRHPAEIIERIQEMKYETYHDMKDRTDPWLAERIAREWGLEAPGKKNRVA